MKKVLSVVVSSLVLMCIGSRAEAVPVTFTFESANGVGPITGVEYGSLDPQGFSALARDGFNIDVAATGTPNLELHFHEVDSTVNFKVPDRPFAERGVLWRDSVAGQDPVFFIPASPFTFSLESLIVGGSSADGSGTTGVRLSALLRGTQMAIVDLPAPTDAYAVYSGASLGSLQGLNMDRLEFIGLSTNATAYYMLDNIVFQTSPVPEPTTGFLFVTGLLALVISAWSRKGTA